jgi:hypothetical protein
MLKSGYGRWNSFELMLWLRLLEMDENPIQRKRESSGQDDGPLFNKLCISSTTSSGTDRVTLIPTMVTFHGQAI